MQTQHKPVEFERQFSCISQSKEKRSNSKTIAEETAEFEKRGGKIHVIESPQYSVYPKRISVGHDPQFLAVTKSVAKIKKAAGEETVNLTQAARLANVHVTTVSNWVKIKKLEVVGTQKRGAKMVKVQDVMALKNKHAQGEK